LFPPPPLLLKVDVALMEACAIDLANRVVESRPTKILTLATTGLVLALPLARVLQVGLGCFSFFFEWIIKNKQNRDDDSNLLVVLLAPPLLFLPFYVVPCCLSHEETVTHYALRLCGCDLTLFLSCSRFFICRFLWPMRGKLGA